MAPKPGISGRRGERMTLATPDTCRSVTLGTSLVAPPAISAAISMFEFPARRKDICNDQSCSQRARMWQRQRANMRSGSVQDLLGKGLLGFPAKENLAVGVSFWKALTSVCGYSVKHTQ